MAEFVKLPIKDELQLAELQNPGHKATRGPGDTIVLTPDPEYVEAERTRKGRIARGMGASTQLAELVDLNA